MIKRALLNRAHPPSIGTIPVNTSIPTITPTSPVVGQVLTAGHGNWTNSPTSYAYQWSDSSTGVIVSATASTYTPTSGNTGHTLKVSVIATNGSGSSVSVMSAATGTVTTAGTGGVLDFSQANDSALIAAIMA
jgi:hypothetical protein